MSDISWHNDKKWDILLPIYYTIESILELYAFFLCMSMPIFIHSVHELIGIVRLT